MGNFRKPNEGSPGSPHSSKKESQSRRENSTSTSKKKRTDKDPVGWTNLTRGSRKKPVPLVELSSDTDFEETPDTADDDPEVVIIESVADEPPKKRLEKNEVEVLLYDVISDTDEEESHENTINAQTRTEQEPMPSLERDNIIENGQSNGNLNAEDGNNNEWGRGSDQDSYVTFFIPTNSNLETAQNKENKKNKKNKKRDDISEASSNSSSDFELVVNCNDKGPKVSSSNCVDNNTSSSESEHQNGNAESSDFNDESSSQELITARLRSSRKRHIVGKTPPVKQSNAKRSRFEAEKKKVVKKKSTKRVTRQTRSKVVKSGTDEDEDSSNSSHNSSSESDEEIRSPRKRVRTRRSTRQTTPKKLSKKERIRQEAFEKLRKKRENQAKKPKRKSPVRDLVTSDEEEDSDSDSNYSSGLSPVPIVSNSSDEGTDFNDDGSTPSSSSVTSSAETDEEPDLEIGGSEGEKDLPNSEEVSEVNGDAEVASCSSSSDGEPPSDGRNDTRCILCKNLRSANIVGRASMNNPSNWCKCGECKIFSHSVRDYDLVCCREIKTVKDFLNEELEDKNVCITNHPRFEADVLKNEGYARSISKHKEPSHYWQQSYWREHDDRHSSRRVGVMSATAATESFKRAPNQEKTWKSLLSYKYWIFDKLGESDSRQMVIPACVKAKVYDAFGTHTEFRPFRAHTTCPCSKHCGPASEYY